MKSESMEEKTPIQDQSSPNDKHYKQCQQTRLSLDECAN